MKYTVQYGIKRKSQPDGPGPQRLTVLVGVPQFETRYFEAENDEDAKKIAEGYTAGLELVGPVMLFSEKERREFEESIHQALKKLSDEKKNRGSGTFPTGTACRTHECPGEIVREVQLKYLGDPMHMIIGPGYENQLTPVTTGYYCPVCQVVYRGLPA